MKKWLFLSVLFLFSCEKEYIDLPDGIGNMGDPIGIEKEQPFTLPTNGLVAWYPFNGNANDESSNNNNGIITDAVLSTDRHENSNSSYYFTNHEDIESTPNDDGYYNSRIDVDELDTSTIINALSISFWFMREGRGYISPRPFEFWVPNDGEGKLVTNIRNDENVLIFEHVIGDKPIFFNLPYPNNNTWEHYVYTIGSGKAKFFRNGEFLGEIDVGMSVIKLGSDFAMGRMNHPSWDALSGRLDDIAIYNRVLTTDEITGINKL